MRSRYSRRKYSLKYGKRKSDSIDDKDLAFLESLIYFHKSYVDNFNKRLKLDITLLSPKYQNIYDMIYEKYPLVKISENQADLYRNLDLNYEGEEFHYRNIREQIVEYLDSKKHQIFTTHRVEFFLKIIFNSDVESLRNICKEIVFQLNSKQPNTQSEKLSNKVPKLSSSVEYSQLPKIQQIIRRVLETEQDDCLINDKIMHRFAELETLLHPYIEMLDELEDTKQEENFIDIVDSITDDKCDDEDMNQIEEGPEIIELSDGDDENNSDGIDDSVSSTISPTTERPDITDFGQMIDFLLHRCSVSHSLHPLLLLDNQMHIELNGFLLFVNFAIRFSLNYPLGRYDRAVFECIFASALVTGFSSVVTIVTNSNGDKQDRAIRIDRLTHPGLRVVRTRLSSMQLSIDHVDRTTSSTMAPLYCVLIRTNIDRMVMVTLEYLRTYRETGKLNEL